MTTLGQNLALFGTKDKLVIPPPVRTNYKVLEISNKSGI